MFSTMIDYDEIQNSKNIHPTAIIEEGAVIGKNVKIGPYCVIGAQVVIGDNCTLKSHVVIEGRTTIGSGNVIYPFAVIGEEPQDLKYEGEESRLEIGDNNKIREHVTIHTGTKGDHMLTKVGSNNLLMVNVHIAHDCIVGDHCILANNATLAGHVQVGDYAVLGGLCAIHQFVKIGEHAMIGGMTGVGGDVIPYGVVIEERSASLEAINITGLKRRDFSKEEMNSLRHFYKDVFEAEEGCIFDLIEKVKDKYKDSATVKNVMDFLANGSKRQLCVKRKK